MTPNTLLPPGFSNIEITSSHQQSTNCSLVSIQSKLSLLSKKFSIQNIQNRVSFYNQNLIK